MTSKRGRESYESLIASLRDVVWETEDTADALDKLYDLVWAIKDEQTLRDIKALAGRMRNAGSRIWNRGIAIEIAAIPIPARASAGSEAGRGAC